VARRFAPALTADDVRMSKQDPRVMGICIKTMAEADKVSMVAMGPGVGHVPGSSYGHHCTRV